ETERREILDHLKSASVRTFELLENLLTWARSQRGSLPFEPVHFPLCEVIAENLGLFGTAAQGKGISLINECTEDFQVFADRNMVSTVIRNLISNALKFTYPEGTITIGIELQDQDSILVFVKDTGMGIPPATLENLFKIEQRTMIKGTANETGTGLGLILCKDFVVKNGGTIGVSSTPGTGSTFSFTLKTN
ncbi:MAG: HAMP domain-containing sensor histidine kinase, partial [bacterium]